MGLFDFLFGEKEKTVNVPTMTGEQQAFFNQLLSSLSGPMGMGMQNLSQILSGSPEAFAAFEAPAKRQFEQEIIPSLSERFSSLGSGGAQHSSAFGQQLGQAGAGLSENLAAMRAQLQQNALQQLMGFSGQALGTKAFEPIYRPQSYGFLGSLGGGLSQGMGMGIGGGLSKLFF